VQFTYR